MPNVGDIIRASDIAIPAGSVIPFYNVTLSGRYPIFWGKTEADTSWLVCDGGDDLHGGNVPDLSNRFIMGTTSASETNKTGGSTTTSETTLTGSTSGTHRHWMFTYRNVNPGEGIEVTSTTSPSKYNRIPDVGSYEMVYATGHQNDIPSLGLTSTVTGGSGAHTHTITPPYYSLIYLVKLP